MLGRDLWLDHDLDALQMRGEAPARTRIPLWLGRGIAVPVGLGLDGCDAGLDLFKDKRLLLLRLRPKLLGLPAVPLAQEFFQDRRQPGDTLIGARLCSSQRREFCLQTFRGRELGGHGNHHSLQAFSIIGQGQLSVCHGS